jgi:hypothetical protein
MSSLSFRRPGWCARLHTGLGFFCVSVWGMRCIIGTQDGGQRAESQDDSEHMGVSHSLLFPGWFILCWKGCMYETANTPPACFLLFRVGYGGSRTLLHHHGVVLPYASYLVRVSPFQSPLSLPSQRAPRPPHFPLFSQLGLSTTSDALFPIYYVTPGSRSFRNGVVRGARAHVRVIGRRM